MCLLKSIKLEWVNKILVSLAKIIGVEVLFIILGKWFIYKRFWQKRSCHTYHIFRIYEILEKMWIQYGIIH